MSLLWLAYTTTRKRISSAFLAAMADRFVLWLARMSANRDVRRMAPLIAMFAAAIYTQEVLDDADSLLEKVRISVRVISLMALGLSIGGFLSALLFTPAEEYKKEVRGINEFQAAFIGGSDFLITLLSLIAGETTWGQVGLSLLVWALWLLMVNRYDRVTRRTFLAMIGALVAVWLTRLLIGILT